MAFPFVVTNAESPRYGAIPIRQQRKADPDLLSEGHLGKRGSDGDADEVCTERLDLTGD